MYCVGSSVSQRFAELAFWKQKILPSHFYLFFSLQNSRENCTNSLKRNDYLGFSLTTAIPNLEKDTERLMENFQSSPSPQLQDNESAALACSLRWTPLPNFPHRLRQSKISGTGTNTKDAERPWKLTSDFPEAFRKHFKTAVLWNGLFWNEEQHTTKIQNY